MTWTMGMLQHQAELARRTEGKTGMDFVYAKLRELNHLYAWCPDTKDTLWPIVNRMLWRFSAMYRGGDCYLAGFPGFAPHERLWQKGRNKKADEFRNPEEP